MKKVSKEFLIAYDMMRKENKTYLVGCIFVIIAACATVGSSLTLKYLVDDVLIANRPQYLWLLQAIFIILVTIQTFSQIYKTKLCAKAASCIMNRLKKKMCQSVLGCEYKELEKAKKGKIITTFQYDLDGLNNFFMDGVAQLLGSIVTIIITITFMLILSWQMTLITLPIFPILLVIFSKMQKHVEKKGNALQCSRQENLDLLSRMLDGTAIIKIFHLQKIFASKYGISGEKTQQCSVELSLTNMIMSLASWSMIMVPYQAIMYGIAGTWYFKSGTPTIGLMLAFANYANSLIGPFLSVQQYQQNWAYAKVCLRNVVTTLSMEQEKQSIKGQSMSEIKNYSYHIQHVYFGYQEKSMILENKSFNFEENNINVIYGKSGSGKSTLLKLLFGFYPQYKGSILLDRTPINNFNLEEYRKKIAYVPQDIVLLETTIIKNLRLADENVKQNEIWEALDMISMREEIERLPAGIETETGERGERLSGGQRQRILIAMALIKNAPIIIFDEPTSALDVANSYNLMRLLEKIKTGHTIIIASHDCIVREFADIVYDFEVTQ